jgi:hypothetical protein
MSLTDLYRKRYHEIKSEWCGVPEVFDRPDVLEERHRIDVDCRRTDRTHPLFSDAYNDIPGEADADHGSRRYSTISPQLVEIGAQSPSNEHIDRMGGVLLTYNFYDKDLGKINLDFPALLADPENEGYVQGMSDLCAPLYVVMEVEEELTFWCFVEVMNRMVSDPDRPLLRVSSFAEPELPPRPERHEETAIDFARTDQRHGSRAVPASWFVAILRYAGHPRLLNIISPAEKTEGLNLFFCFR